MSFIIAVATTERIIIKSDGIVIRDDKHIESNICDKTIAFSDYVIGGFGGNFGICKQTLSKYHAIQKEEKPYIESVVFLISDILNQLHGCYPDKSASFILGGVNKHGSPILTSVSRDGIFSSVPSESKTAMMAIEPTGFEGQGILKCAQLIKDKISIEDAMEESVFYLSGISRLVNTQISTREISLT